MEFLKSKWREISIVLGILLSAFLIFLLINYLLDSREKAIAHQQATEDNYNNILSGETSEEILENELQQILDEQMALGEVLPVNFKIQEANAKLSEIIRNNKILNIDDCTVTELPNDGSEYKKVEIRVKNFYGTYEQVQDFMNYIKNYGSKIVIESMNFEVEDFTKNMKGENLVFVLYGLA